MPGVGGHVGGSRRVTGGAGGSPGWAFVGIAGSGMGGDRSSAGSATPDFAAGPGPSRFEGLAGAVVRGALGFEVLEDVLSAVGGPPRQGFVVVGRNRFGGLGGHVISAL